MALFNTSNPWEINSTGDELCTTFLKDVAGERKKNKQKNGKGVQNLKSIKKTKNELKKVSKSKKKILQKLSKNLSHLKNKLPDGEDKMLIKNDDRSPTSKNVKKIDTKSMLNKRKKINTKEIGDSKKLQKKSKQDKLKGKMQKLAVSIGNSTVKMTKVNGDFKPLLKSHKKEKSKRNGKNQEKGTGIKNTDKKLKNSNTHLTKTASSKIIKKINKNELKADQEDTDSKLYHSDNVSETNPINSAILKKRKKQLDKLQNLVLKKQKNELIQSTQLLKKKANPELSLRERMMEKLKAARFRFLNEQIYTTTGKETQKVFKNDPNAFKAYHQGYRQQVRNWPLNPLDIVIKSIQKMPKTHVIADFGCGEARLAETVEQKVFSFDLVALNERVTPCDMAHVPLEDSSVDVTVFCLSLMGTNLRDYLLEANRVLKKGGLLKIAEVESRFEDVGAFVKSCEQYGFKKTWMDLSHNLFYFLDFKKIETVKGKEKKLPVITLQPCIYKKR